MGQFYTLGYEVPAPQGITVDVVVSEEKMYPEDFIKYKCLKVTKLHKEHFIRYDSARGDDKYWENYLEKLREWEDYEDRWDD